LERRGKSANKSIERKQKKDEEERKCVLKRHMILPTHSQAREDRCPSPFVLLLLFLVPHIVMRGAHLLSRSPLLDLFPLFNCRAACEQAQFPAHLSFSSKGFLSVQQTKRKEPWMLLIAKAHTYEKEHVK